jgi:hypothetical protein
MTVMYLPLLPSNDCLLCLLVVTLSFLSSVRPDVLGRCSKQTILSPSEEEEEVHCSAQSNACNEGRTLLLSKKKPRRLAAMGGGGGQTGKRSHKPT